MNLHLLFACGAAAACVSIGFHFSRRLSRLVDALSQWDKALLALSGAIRYRRASALDALEAGAREEKETLPALLKRMKERPGETPAALIRELPWHPLLPPEAVSALSDCLLSLFLPTLPQQEQGLALSRIPFDDCLSKAREAREKNARLYGSLGWLSGAALFILLC